MKKFYFILISFFCLLFVNKLSSQSTVIRRASGNLINGVQNYNVQGTPNLRKAIETNGIVMNIFMGDSLMTGINGINTYLYPVFTNITGYAGAICGPGSALQQITLAGGATYITGNFAKWYSGYVNIPNGGSVIYAPLSGSFIGNVIFVAYYQSNAVGTASVQTNLAGGAFATAATIDGNNVGAAGANVLFLTNVAGALPTQLKIVGASGVGVDILAAGVLNFMTNGFVLFDMAVDGQDLGQFFTTSTNITAPIFGKLHPTSIMYKCTDSATVVNNNIQAFTNFISNYLTNTDVIILGIQPVEPAFFSNPDVIQQNIIWYNTCVNNGWAYYDGNAIFIDYPTGLRNGFLRSGADPHLTTSGNRYQADLFLSFLGLFTGTLDWYNAPASKPILWTGDNLEYGNINFSGPPGIAGSSLNWKGTNGVSYNMGFYADPTFGVLRLIFRNSASGANETFVIGNNGTGTEEIAPAPNVVSGVPLFLGRFGKTFDNIVGSNIWCYGTTGNVFNIIGTNAYPANWTIFQMTADGSNTNITTTTNTLWGAGIGSRRVDPNGFQVGRELTAEMEGNYFDGATPGQVRLMVMLNTSSATNIAAQVLFSPVANITTGDNFRIKTKSVCRTTGASGTISTSGCIEIDNGGTPTLRYFTNQVLTVDTTAQLTFDIASTNGASTDSFLTRNGTIMLH